MFLISFYGTYSFYSCSLLCRIRRGHCFRRTEAMLSIQDGFCATRNSGEPSEVTALACVTAPWRAPCRRALYSAHTTLPGQELGSSSGRLRSTIATTFWWSGTELKGTNVIKIYRTPGSGPVPSHRDSCETEAIPRAAGHKRNRG